MALPHVPASASDLEAAIHSGVLVEGQHFDAKAELEPGVKGNTRLAIDLASFAIDAGLLAVGVAQVPHGGGHHLLARPVQLAGLRERVSQVGLSRVDAPIVTVTRELETEPGSGYLLILVPASPDAPHMVDGKYRGRSDTTNYSPHTAGRLRADGAAIGIGGYSSPHYPPLSRGCPIRAE